MSRTSESRAETAKLGRLLGVEDQRELAFLLPVPAHELRDYREAVTDLLYDDDQELLQRTADAARLLPARTLAAIGERALGPLICARLSGLLDPRRAGEVVSAITTDTVVAVSAAMAANGEHVAMGRFVAYLDEAALSLCIEALCDEDLLRVAFVMEGEERLTSVFEMIGAERTERMLAAAHVNGLLEEAEHMAGRLPAAS